MERSPTPRPSPRSGGAAVGPRRRASRGAAAEASGGERGPLRLGCPRGAPRAPTSLRERAAALAPRARRGPSPRAAPSASARAGSSARVRVTRRSAPPEQLGSVLASARPPPRPRRPAALVCRLLSAPLRRPAALVRELGRSRLTPAYAAELRRVGSFKTAGRRAPVDVAVTRRARGPRPPHASRLTVPDAEEFPPTAPSTQAASIHRARRHRRGGDEAVLRRGVRLAVHRLRPEYASFEDGGSPAASGRTGPCPRRPADRDLRHGPRRRRGARPRRRRHHRHPRRSPFPGGRRFHFTDPSGNELAVWSDR
jgi:hypothetical protein